VSVRPSFLSEVPLARRLLPVLVVAWLVPRFVPLPVDPGPAARRAVEAVRGGPSPESGRLEVWGLPNADMDPADLLSRPEILAARVRLQQRVAAENDALALRAADIARRLEPTKDDLVGLRLSGWLIPFYGPHADVLRRVADEGNARPWETLRGLTVTLESRLEEPPEGVNPEISGQRRDLTRLFRDTDDALNAAQTNVTNAVDAFRRDALDAAAAAAGPFRRRGRGAVVEILLAALLGATVREAVRRRATAGGTLLRLSFAPALALGVLLPLEGSSLLPVSPLLGLSMAFLPMAFGLGFVTGGLLRVASRVERLFADEGGTPPDAAAFERGDTRDEEGAAARRGDEGSAFAGSTAHPAPPGPSPAEPAPPPADLRPLRDRVRELAREVMAATGEGAAGDGMRTEWEIPEEMPVGRTLSEAAVARATEKLPFARRHRS
jgi:hypothetical protein